MTKFPNKSKQILNEALERKRKAQEPVRIIVNKNEYDKIKADIDYLAMMSGIELEEVTDNE